MNRFCQPLFANTYYHVYNRGINGGPLFLRQKNYSHFLNKVHFYLREIADIFAYCLLPNHFHLLIRIKRSGTTEKPEDRIVSEQFRKLFIAYSMAVNQQEERTGSLFERPFKRLAVLSPSHFMTVLSYIHMNPEMHGIARDYRQYRFSSYQSLISEKPTHLRRDEVIGWFGSKDSLIRYHEDIKALHMKRSTDDIFEKDVICRSAERNPI